MCRRFETPLYFIAAPDSPALSGGIEAEGTFSRLWRIKSLAGISDPRSFWTVTG